MGHKKRNLLLSTSTIFVLISAFTLIPVANSQPVMEKLNLNENIKYQLKKEILESKKLSISYKKSLIVDLNDILRAHEKYILEEFPILLLIVLILASPILIPALFIVYLIFVWSIIIDLLENIPEYESLWEILRVFVYIILSPLGFPLFLEYLIILLIFHLFPQLTSFTSRSSMRKLIVPFRWARYAHEIWI
jgi:hypothetical protein